MTSPACVIVAAPLQFSVEVIPAVLGAGTRLAHCTVTFAGQFIMAGGVLSNTVMI
jgi:hypothetical protein